MQNNRRAVKLAVIFVFLNSFGFPGSYTRVFGSFLKPLVEYTSFFIQIFLMLFTSANNFLDIKIVKLKETYLPIYLYFIVTMMSLFITVDFNEQLVSCIRVCVTGFFAIWVYENFSAEEILEEIYIAQILFIMASIAFPILFPGSYIRGSSYLNDFVGIGSVKNEIAAECAFGFIMQSVLLRIYIEKKKHISIFFLSFFIIQIGVLLSAHSTGAILMSISVSAYMMLAKKRHQIGFIYVAGSVLFLLLALTILPIFSPILTALGKDATLTGRIPLWNQLIEVMQSSHTLLGYGYGMFWKNPQAIALMHAGFERGTFMAQMTSGAHNNILELLANQGLIGVTTIFTAVLLSFRNIKALTNETYLFCTGYMLFYMIHGWTERGWSTYGYALLFLYLALAAGGGNVQNNSSSYNLSSGMENSRTRYYKYRKPDAQTM